MKLDRETIEESVNENTFVVRLYFKSRNFVDHLVTTSQSYEEWADDIFNMKSTEGTYYGSNSIHFLLEDLESIVLLKYTSNSSGDGIVK